MEKNWVTVYDDLAKNYHDPISQSGYVIDGKPLDESVFENWFQNIQSYFRIEASNHLIDVGCGSGIFLQYFAKYTSHLYGIDTSQEQLDNAQKHCPNAELTQGDALNIGFEHIQFDRIFCNSVFLLFESLEYAEKVLLYFVNRVKQGGKIWVGDLPEVNELVDGNYRRIGKSVNLPFQHYPEVFLFDFCYRNKLKGQKIEQNIPNKESAKYRYDFLIEKIN